MSDYEFCESWGCAEKHYAKGFCSKHYLRKLRAEGRMGTTTCTFDGCDRLTGGNRFCNSHERRRREGKLDAPVRPYKQVGCSVDGCEGAHYGLGMCNVHYAKAKYNPAADHADKMLRQKYGITRDDRDAMSAAQGNKCAICGKESQLVVDHDHTHCDGPRKGCRDCVRGMLCVTCNTRLGKVEGTDWLGRAQAYLANPPGLCGDKASASARWDTGGAPIESHVAAGGFSEGP